MIYKAIILGVIFFFSIIAGLLQFLPGIPDNQAFCTVVEDREGEILNVRIASDEQWRFPQNETENWEKIKTCLILFEDEWFYSHPGINPVSTLKALKANLEAGKIVRGGSTLSMQLARIHHGKNKTRSLVQKFYETLIALKLELFLGKDVILDEYLFSAPFGGNIVGVESASWKYFGVSPEQLSWAGSALLAVLPNNPSNIFPGHSKKEPIKEIRDKLLRKLCLKGVISETDYELSILEPVPETTLPLRSLSPWILDRLEKEGKGGKRTQTYLDQELQREMLFLARNNCLVNQGKYIHNIAILVTELGSGKVLAYVGNNPVNSGKYGEEVDIIMSERSPGSLLKPLLYSCALNDGLLEPRQFLPDIPIFFTGYSPKNFDRKFRGLIPANEALVSSLNVPFVWLLSQYNIRRFYDNLKAWGMEYTLREKPGHYGLSIILGGCETRLWDITAMYGSLGRRAKFGIKGNEFHANNLIKDEKPKKYKGFNLDPWIANWVLKELQNLKRPHEEDGWRQFAGSDYISWKTGTSIGMRDAWAVGLNENYVVGVWVGNANGTGRPGMTGASYAAPVMFKAFDVLASRSKDITKDFWSKNRNFLINTKLVKYCKTSGYIAGRFCQKELLRVSEKMGNNEICPYHKPILLSGKSGKRVLQDCQEAGQELVDTSWFEIPPFYAMYYKSYNFYLEPPDWEEACKDMLGRKNPLNWVYPRKKNKILIPVEITGENGRVVFEVAHRDLGQTIFWHLNQKYLGSTFEKHRMGFFITPGEHEMVAVDQDGNDLKINFEVVRSLAGI
jgi:penicillin-binding protein 1C